MKTITFTDYQYKRILKAAPQILVGRRGNSSRKARIRKKVFRETVICIINTYMKEA